MEYSRLMGYIVYIGAALVIGLLIGFIALSVLWLRKIMLHNIRRHTLELLSVYDELLEDKSRKLSEMEEVLQLHREELSSLQTENEAILVSTESPAAFAGEVLLAMADRAAGTSYRDASLGETYHRIRDNFSFQIEDILSALSQDEADGDGPAGHLLKELDHDLIYQLSTLRTEDQVRVLQESLEEEGVLLFNEYLGSHPNFSVFAFYDYLKGKRAEEPQRPQLYISRKVEGSRVTSNTTRIVEDSGICEGFQLEMNGKLYDYCIKTKELS